jgi:hypothetical protein
MDLLVFDMAALRVECDRQTVALWSPDRQLLWSAPVEEVGPAVSGPFPADDLSRRELVFTVLDRALGEARVFRVDAAGLRRSCRLGLYNPYTAEVAVSATPNTRAFSAAAPVPVPPEGALAVLDDGSAAGVVRFDAGTVCAEVERSFAGLSRALAAHAS